MPVEHTDSHRLCPRADLGRANGIFSVISVFDLRKTAFDIHKNLKFVPLWPYSYNPTILMWLLYDVNVWYGS